MVRLSSWGQEYKWGPKTQFCRIFSESNGLIVKTSQCGLWSTTGPVPITALPLSDCVDTEQTAQASETSTSPVAKQSGCKV